MGGVERGMGGSLTGRSTVRFLVLVAIESEKRLTKLPRKLYESLGDGGDIVVDIGVAVNE
jgi:hypothetical protein